MAVEEENILTLTHRRASVWRGAVGCDVSCKRLLWLWRGDRSGGSNGGWFGGDGSLPVFVCHGRGERCGPAVSPDWWRGASVSRSAGAGQMLTV
jgi:hypothetical protein